MMKYLFVLLFFVTGCYAEEPVGTLDSAFEQGKIIIKTQQNTYEMPVYLADTLERRRRGLMNVTNLPQDMGMYFVFEEIAAHRFWMKNTLIPLDVIFVTPEGKVTYVEYNRQPHDERPFGPDDPVQYALEINAGQARMLGIEIGDRISIAPQKP